MDIVDVPVCNVISDVPRASRSDAGTYFVASAAGATELRVAKHRAFQADIKSGIR